MNAPDVHVGGRKGALTSGADDLYVCVYIESQCVTTFHNLPSLASDVYKSVEGGATECTGKDLVTQPLEVVLRLRIRLLGPLVRPDALGTLRAVKLPTGHARDVGVVEETCRDADILAVGNVALLFSHGAVSSLCVVLLVVTGRGATTGRVKNEHWK